MKIDALALRLGLTTLRSRPTLTVLAVLLLSIGTGLLGAMIGTTRLLENLQTTFLSALTLDVELSDESELNRQRLMPQLEAWPGVESVRFVSKDEVMQELQAETADDLARLLGSNPFPSLLRVRFHHSDLRTLDSLEQSLRGQNGVQSIFYPREIWTTTANFLSRLKGDIGFMALFFAAISVGLVGLCLRAQVRNRKSAWELLSLLGLSDRTFGLALLVQELAVGIVAGILSCILLAGLSTFYSWLLLRELRFEVWIYLLTMAAALSLALIAGLLTPRRGGRT